MRLLVLLLTPACACACLPVLCQDWLSERDRSPMTNQPLKSKELTPNYVLRSAIIEAREAAAAARQ